MRCPHERPCGKPNDPCLVEHRLLSGHTPDLGGVTVEEVTLGEYIRDIEKLTLDAPNE
jgi:hypothetical protein